MAKKMAEPFRILNYKVNTEYIRYRDKIPEKYRAKDREELRKILKTICKHIATNIIERKGGVLIKGLGYFFVWKIPRKMTYSRFVANEGVEEHYNYHTNHHMYSPIFLGANTKADTFKGWYMDNAFTRYVKGGINKKLLSGFSYKMYVYSLFKMN